MDKLQWIIAVAVFLIWTGLAVFSGYHLKKDKVCPEIRIKDSSYTVPLPPQTAQIKVTKKAKPKDSAINTSVHILPIYGDELLDSLDWFPHIEDVVTTYGEIVDSTIVFGKDSLDFVAEITFNERTKSFENTFDFSLRLNKLIREVVRYVEVPAEIEVYQNGFVILLGLVTAFLFGLVF